MENNEEKKNEEVVEHRKEKKCFKIKFKTVVIIMIILAVVLIGFIIYAKLSRDNCEDSANYYDGHIYSTLPTPLPISVDKPIIYIYPEITTNLTIRLGYPDKIICSYPKYTDGWHVTANPDGTLVDNETGRRLYALYWEGQGSVPRKMEEGFIVKGIDSITFLEEKLAILGLNEREAEEFIVYWLPKLEENKYNFIRFATMEEINEFMPLEVSVKSDSVIRVLMQFKGLDNPIEVKEQQLETPERTGFTVVEWGGTEIK